MRSGRSTGDEDVDRREIEERHQAEAAAMQTSPQQERSDASLRCRLRRSARRPSQITPSVTPRGYVEEIADIIIEDSECGRYLRQNKPLLGVLSWEGSIQR